MVRHRISLLVIVLFLLLVLTTYTNISAIASTQSIPQTSNPINPNDQHCLVPCNQLYTGASKDGIPAIDNPNFRLGTEENNLLDSEIVIGIVFDGEPRAYPYEILNWHEIVNDEINGSHFSITYCPLTGSGLVFKTDVIGNSELGVSGKLFENNLVFYDRNTESYWSQMMHTSVMGEQIGSILPYSEAVETTWGNWKNLHPNTIVLTRDTGYSREYSRYPYNRYRSNTDILFPTSYDPGQAPYNLFHAKAITQIIKIDKEVLLLPRDELVDLPALNLIFAGTSLITFSGPTRLINTFESRLSDGTELLFSPAVVSGITNESSYGLPVFADQFGSIWNFNGIAIEGPSKGERLNLLPTFNAFWFAASTFYYDAQIFLTENLSEEAIPETFTTSIVSSSTDSGDGPSSSNPASSSEGTTSSETTGIITEPQVVSEFSSFDVDPEQQTAPIPVSYFWIVAIPILQLITHRLRIRGERKRSRN